MSLPPAVEEIIRKYPGAVDAGAPFPDYLYTCGKDHGDGEFAHWHKFHHYFADFIREKHPNWAAGDEHGAKLVAFLMGIASHYIADVNWHGLGQQQTGFIQQMGLEDAGCSGDLCPHAHTTCDIGGEFITTMQMSAANIRPTKWWVPTADIVSVFASANITVKPSWINECVALFAGEVVGVKLAKPVAWRIYASRSAFLEQNLEDFFIGGMDDNAVWSALVWSEMVGWLQGNQSAPTLYKAAQASVGLRRPTITAPPATKVPVTSVPEGAVEVVFADAGEESSNSSDSLEYTGSALAICDLDGDGDRDWVVGSPGKRGRGQPLIGGVSVRLGGVSKREISLAGSAWMARFGSALACSDVDGDGMLFVAAPTEGPWEIEPRPGQDWYFENQSYYGAVHAYRWDGFTLTPTWTWKSDVQMGVCGSAMAAAGGNIIVGCPYVSHGFPSVGRVVALDHAGNVLWDVYGSTLGEKLGSAIASLPDFGLIAVGAPGWRGAGLMATGAVLLLNATNGCEVKRLSSSEAKAQFGQALAADGATLWVGAPGANISKLFPSSGRVDQILLHRGSDGNVSMTRQQSLQPPSRTSLSRFGSAMVAVPKGGGVVVGSPSSSEDRGAIHIFSADGVHREVHDGPGAHSRFGAALAATSDVVLVGAPKESLGTSSAIVGDQRQGMVYHYDMPKPSAVSYI